MPQKPPPPLPQSFLVCRQVFQDRQTGEHVLIAPFFRVQFPAFPAALRCSIFVAVTGGHGAYRFGLQHRDQDGCLLGEVAAPELIPQNDPLAPLQFCWRDVGILFPQPGRYDLILLANGEDLAHHALDVVLQANA